MFQERSYSLGKHPYDFAIVQPSIVYNPQKGGSPVNPDFAYHFTQPYGIAVPTSLGACCDSCADDGPCEGEKKSSLGSCCASCTTGGPCGLGGIGFLGNKYMLLAALAGVGAVAYMKFGKKKRRNVGKRKRKSGRSFKDIMGGKGSPDEAYHLRHRAQGGDESALRRLKQIIHRYPKEEQEFLKKGLF